MVCQMPRGVLRRIHGTSQLCVINAFMAKKVSHIICLLSNMYEDICLSVQGRTSKKKIHFKLF